jgi:hypothetical protein
LLISLTDFENIREYDLRLSAAEDNPNGFIVQVLPTFQFENEYVEAISGSGTGNFKIHEFQLP